jgi:predicted HTH transcriptional regulator
MARLSESKLKRLIQGSETTTVEFKVAVPRPVELAERLCGMANAQGGRIIIGVEDTKQNIVGIPDERIAMTIDTILRAARQNIKPVLVLDPAEPEIYVVQGKQLVVATVPASKGPVYQSGGVFWVRRGTHTVPLSMSDLLEEERENNEISTVFSTFAFHCRGSNPNLSWRRPLVFPRLFSP